MSRDRSPADNVPDRSSGRTIYRRPSGQSDELGDFRLTIADKQTFWPEQKLEQHFFKQWGVCAEKIARRFRVSSTALNSCESFRLGLLLIEIGAGHGDDRVPGANVGSVYAVELYPSYWATSRLATKHPISLLSLATCLDVEVFLKLPPAGVSGSMASSLLTITSPILHRFFRSDHREFTLSFNWKWRCRLASAPRRPDIRLPLRGPRSITRGRNLSVQAAAHAFILLRNGVGAGHSAATRTRHAIRPGTRRSF